MHIGKRRRADPCCDAHRFVEVVQRAFHKLPKHGKPTAEDVTVLAAIVLKSGDNTVSLVSLATGTKCIGHRQRQEDGTIVHDLHAEVLVRRTAMHWVYQQLKRCFVGETGECHKRVCVAVRTNITHVMPADLQQALSSMIRSRVSST